MTYYTTTIPLKGTMKHRYTDFVVQEIDLKGNICRSLAEGVSEEVVIPENPDNKLFLHCTMQKVNIDVQNSIKSLALNQKCGKTRFGFAGMKDKRGITSQRISIYEPNIEQLRKFNYRQIKLFDFEWSDTKIDLGDLKGNAFNIVIRDLDFSKNELQNIFDKFKLETLNGIPNYFGDQRFGGIRQITHEVGKLLFQNKTKEAVLLYLSKTNDKEDENTREARELAGQEKYLEAFKKLKGKEFRYERAILNALIKEPNNFVGAFKQLPKNLLIMFPHAYQSYLFNKYLDLRIEKLGHNYLNKFIDDKIENNEIMGPIFGYEYQLSKGENGALENEILKCEGIELDEFKVKGFPEISVQGMTRQINLKINDLQLLSIEDDEFFPGKRALRMSFSLTKNSYATVVLNELMKNSID